jgi:hypothetical protein
MNFRAVFTLGLGLLIGGTLQAVEPTQLEVGQAKQFKAESHQWRSSDPSVAKVYSNGFVIGLKPGTAQITAGGGAEFPVTVSKPDETLVDPSKFKQYADNKEFKDARGRRCVGTELNAATAGQEYKIKTDLNRTEDPDPAWPSETRLWQLDMETPVFDGTGVLMGKAAPSRELNGRKVPATHLNYGMSKVIDGTFCVYAFSITIIPSSNIAGLVKSEAGDTRKHSTTSTVGTSAWVPLDSVVHKETLLEVDGIGQGKLPHLPLEDKKYLVTGGNPNQYVTSAGKEVSIIPNYKFGAVPSHYLRRPSGTVNIEYCVPGFGLGGQNVDSVLVTSHAIFQPAKGVRQFVQPTWYPVGHPQEGKKSNLTETFIYGALEAPNSEAVYGWMAKEALAEIK